MDRLQLHIVLLAGAWLDHPERIDDAVQYPEAMGFGDPDCLEEDLPVKRAGGDVRIDVAEPAIAVAKVAEGCDQNPLERAQRDSRETFRIKTRCN
jgi:hypothetical protein